MPSRLVPSVLLAGLAACSSVVPWQLDREQIVAVRATPPHVLAGAPSTIDVLVGHAGSAAEVVAPTDVTVDSPTSLTSVVSGATIEAPGETELDQVRSDLGLTADDPVPLELEVEADDMSVLKTVYLGDSADNPTLDGVLIDGVAPPTDPTAVITVDADTDIPLSVNEDDSANSITWLTSCGTLDNYSQHDATLHVYPSDPQSGQLALVLRDASAGVVWVYWSITAE